MGFFFQNYTIASVLIFIVLVAGLILFNEITRRNLVAAIVAYGIIPIILVIGIMAGWIQTPSSKTWFGVVKTFSALAGVWGFMAIRYLPKVEKSKFAFYFPALILAINIMEAIFRDFEVFSTYKELTVDEAGLTLLGGPWNVLNGIAGIILIFTLTGWMGIKVAKTKSRDMVWADQLWFWILAYDLWNVAYCYNCISTRAMYSGVALILSCTLAEAFCKRGIWLQHRAQTLALFGMFSLFFNYQGSSLFGIEASYNPNAWMTLSVLALIANVACGVYEIYVIKKYKKNPLKEEVYTHLRAYKQNMADNKLL